VSGLLPAAYSTVGPAGAAESEQVSSKKFSSKIFFFSPMYPVSAAVGHRLSIESFHSLYTCIASIYFKSKLPSFHKVLTAVGHPQTPARTFLFKTIK